MLKLLGISIIILTLSGCSFFSTMQQNALGIKVEAYYSTVANVVCFTTSSTNQENIYCLPASKVDISKLKIDEWTVI